MADNPGEGKDEQSARQSDEEMMSILLSFSSQQKDHEILIEQTQSFQKYWDLQQQWNHFAIMNKNLKERRSQLQLRHQGAAEVEETQRRNMENHFRMIAEHNSQERAKEMEKVELELGEHRRRWNDAIKKLNAHQENMHDQWSGRVRVSEGLRREYDQNKTRVQNTIRRLQQRMEQKKVATGAKGSSVGDDDVASGGMAIAEGGAVDAAGGPNIFYPGADLGTGVFATDIMREWGKFGIGQPQPAVPNGGAGGNVNPGIPLAKAGGVNPNISRVGASGNVNSDISMWGGAATNGRIDNANDDKSMNCGRKRRRVTSTVSAGAATEEK